MDKDKSFLRRKIISILRMCVIDMLNRYLFDSGMFFIFSGSLFLLLLTRALESMLLEYIHSYYKQSAKYSLSRGTV